MENDYLFYSLMTEINMYTYCWSKNLNDYTVWILGIKVLNLCEAAVFGFYLSFQVKLDFFPAFFKVNKLCDLVRNEYKTNFDFFF